MTHKELRRLNRRQLLELLLVQTQRADDLQAKLDALEAQLQQQALAANKDIPLPDELQQLSETFEATRAAADVYLGYVRKHEYICSQMEANATARAQAIIQDAKQKSDKMHKDVDVHWEQTKERIKEFFQLMDDMHHQKSE